LVVNNHDVCVRNATDSRRRYERSGRYSLEYHPARNPTNNAVNRSGGVRRFRIKTSFVAARLRRPLPDCTFVMSSLEALAANEIPLEHSGSLYIFVDTRSLTESLLVRLRSLCNQLASNRLIVDHCCVTLEGASNPTRRIEFKSCFPIRLWRSIQRTMYGDSALQSSLDRHSSALWLGDAYYHDFIWLHRNFSDPVMQCDGFLFRFCCIVCGRYYFFARSEDSRCPHCKEGGGAYWLHDSEEPDGG